MNANVSKTLKELESFKEYLQTITTVLENIVWDKKQERQGFTIYGVVDFDILFRFLFPVLDTAAKHSVEGFGAEQLAIQYLFSKRPFKNVLIPCYATELKNFIEDSLHPPTSLDSRVNAMYRDLAARVDSADRTKLEQGLQSILNVKSSDRVFIDFVLGGVFKKVITNGIDHFYALLESGALQPADTKEVKEKTEELSEEYRDILHTLFQFRPQLPHSNDTDARAINLIIHLNRANAESKQAYVLLTSSALVKKAFEHQLAMDVKTSRTAPEAKANIIRDIQYFLLRMLLESQEDKAESFNAEELLDLINRYTSVVKELRDFIDNTTQLEDRDGVAIEGVFNEALTLHKRLSPAVNMIKQSYVSPESISALSKEITSGLALSPDLSQWPTTEQIRSRLDEVLHDPEVLTKHYKVTCQKLYDIIEDIEIQLLPIVWYESESDFIYPVRAHDVKDSFVHDAVTSIVIFLNEATIDSVKKAFRVIQSLRRRKPMSLDTLIMCGIVYRTIRLYGDSLKYLKSALDLDPTWVDTYFELGVCCRKLATFEKRYGLIADAWHYLAKAHELDETDPRILKERALLVWYGMEGMWPLPEETENNPIKYCIEACRKALVITLENYEVNQVLMTAIRNDLAYYLAMTGSHSEVNEAIKLIQEALESETSIKPRLASALYDTAGFVYMQFFKITRQVEHLHAANRYFNEAYAIRPRSIVSNHMVECLKLLANTAHRLE